MPATSFRNFPAVSRFAAALLAAAPLSAQTPVPTAPAASGSGTLPYADLADLVLASPVIADATIRSASRIKGAEAAGVAAGKQRFYVEADVGALVRASGGLPQRIGYLLDLAVDARGRAPRLKKNGVLLF